MPTSDEARAALTAADAVAVTAWNDTTATRELIEQARSRLR